MQTAASQRVPAAQRVRCRQIADADLDQLSGMLAHGFPLTSRNHWTSGFSRFRSLPVVEGLPRYGYVLESETGIVGVILLITSRRGERIFSNLSSWYVEPEWRAHSTLLISMATKLKNVTYFNISPSPHTWPTLTAQGFVPYNFGRSAVFAPLQPARGVVSGIIPGDLPEHDLLQVHSGLGCISLVCEASGIVSPFVFQPRRLDRPQVRVADLVFSRSREDFKRCAGPLARWLLRRGMPGILCDGRISGLPAYFAPGKEPRYFKGPHVPTDLAFSEKVIFG